LWKPLLYGKGSRSGLDRIRGDRIDWQAQGFYDEFGDRSNRHRDYGRIRERPVYVEIGGEQSPTRAGEIPAYQGNLVYEPVHGAEGNQADRHVQGRIVEADVAARNNIHHGAVEAEIIGIKIAVAALEVGGERLERDAGDTRIRKLGGKPGLQVDEAQNPVEHRKAIERTVFDPHRRRPGEGAEEVDIGIRPKIGGRGELSQQR